MQQSTIQSLVIPLQDRTLLLPENAIAEVAPMAGLIVESHPERWMLGHKHWVNTRVPVISFETLVGGSLKKHSEHARIAIFKGYGNQEKLPFWGMLVQAMPKAMALSEPELKIVNESMSEAEHLCVELGGQTARIPNLNFIEESIIKSDLH